MSASNFIFPPPPPPPPLTATLGNAPQYGGSSGQSGGRGRGQGRGRGRGRGEAMRGQRGNNRYQPNHYEQHSQNHYGSSGGYQQASNYHPYGGQNPYGHAPNSHTTFDRPTQYTGSFGNINPTYGLNQTYPQFNNPEFQQPSALLSERGTPVTVNPALMRNVSNHVRESSFMTNNRASYQAIALKGDGQAQKHANAQLTNTTRRVVPNSSVSPAVPSFASALFPIPLQPSEAVKETKRKRKRHHNQLGLTPRTDEHESSEEDADVDEELKLAASLNVVSHRNILQFSYKGRNSRLSTPAEIAAWIAERKKRYPTRAKQEEAAVQKAKSKEEARLAVLRKLAQDSVKRAGARPSHDKNREELTKKQAAASTRVRPVDKQGKRSKNLDNRDDLDSAAKARRKAEKLQKRLAKIQKELSLLEAQGAQSENKDPNVSQQSTDIKQDASGDADSDLTRVKGEECNHIANGLLLNPVAAPAQDNMSSETAEATLSTDDSSETDSSTSSDGSTSDDDGTSSNGSSSDDTPREESSKLLATEEAPTMAQRPPKDTALCRSFAKGGKCAYGKKCKFRHEPRPGGKLRKEKESEGPRAKAKTSLHQRLLARQEEEDDERLLQYIVYLGDRGLLSDSRPETDAHPPRQPSEENEENEGRGGGGQDER